MQAIHGARILVAEDNPINQQVAGELLTRSGMQVSIVGNGIEVLNRLQTERFDLVLMDVQMPVMDGLQATRLLRRLPYGHNLPVVAMTASALPKDQQDCLDAGMNAHLAKPIDPAALEAVLQSWIVLGQHVPSVAGAAVTGEAGDAASLANQLPTINVARALEHVGGNVSMYRKFLKSFVGNHGGDGAKALLCLRAGDWSGLARLTHSLAGAAATMGIDEVAELALTLSHQPGNMDPTELSRRVLALAAAQARVVALLEGLPHATRDMHGSA